jgi:PAS domain S-box-containing protein
VSPRSAERKPTGLSKKRIEESPFSFADTFLDCLPVPVFFEDRRGRCRGCNRAFEEFTGETREDLRGKTVFVRAQDAPSGTRRKRKGGPACRSEVRTETGVLTDREGNPRKVVSRTAVLRDSRGRPTGRIRAVREHSGTERGGSLRKSLGRYRTLLDGIEDGYYETDLKGNLTFFNSGLTAITGYSRRGDGGHELPGLHGPVTTGDSSSTPSGKCSGRPFQPDPSTGRSSGRTESKAVHRALHFLIRRRRGPALGIPGESSGTSRSARSGKCASGKPG